MHNEPRKGEVAQPHFLKLQNPFKMENQTLVQKLQLENVNGEFFTKSTTLAEICNQRHSDFSKKALQVLGNETVRKFTDREIYNDKGQTRDILVLPKREAMLMAMSYSYELQAQVYDAWVEAEELLQKALLAPGNEYLLEDEFADKINNGQRKVVINFFRRLLEQKGIDRFIDSIEYTHNKIKQDYRAYTLEQFRLCFSRLVDEQTGRFGAQNAVQIHATGEVIEAKNREFARRSSGRKELQIKELKADLLEYKPKIYEGPLEITSNEFYNAAEYFYEGDDLAIHIYPFRVNAGKHNEFTFMKGDVLLKNEKIMAKVTGGVNNDVFRTKITDTSEFEVIAKVNQDETFRVILHKIA